MIRVTLFDGTDSVVNADLIETIDRTPDTILSLVSGRRILVRDSPETIAERVLAYQRAVRAGTRHLAVAPGGPRESSV